MASLADMIRQNKMRSIDQNPLLGKVSSVLGSAREYGNKVNLPVLGGLGDMFVGKAPEEIENWSYGNSPFQSTEIGLPQIKRERKQSLVDALSTLAGPVSGLAKATEGLPVGMSIKNVANKNQTQDYGQLKEGYPNAVKFGSALKKGISQLVPTQEDLNSPQKMGEWGLSAALNAPMGLTSGAKNIVKELHPDKNYLGWETAEDPIYNHEGDEIGADPYVLIHKVYVHPEDRNKGIATRLMNNAMNEIKKEHPGLPIKLFPIPLDKETDIEKLGEFYEKFGFNAHPDGYMEY